MRFAGVQITFQTPKGDLSRGVGTKLTVLFWSSDPESWAPPGILSGARPFSPANAHNLTSPKFYSVLTVIPHSSEWTSRPKYVGFVWTSNSPTRGPLPSDPLPV